MELFLNRVELHGFIIYDVLRLSSETEIILNRKGVCFMEIKRDYYLDKLIRKKIMDLLRLLQELEGAENLIC